MDSMGDVLEGEWTEVANGLDLEGRGEKENSRMTYGFGVCSPGLVLPLVVSSKTGKTKERRTLAGGGGGGMESSCGCLKLGVLV